MEVNKCSHLYRLTEIYFIHWLGGLYWKKLCLRSCVMPEAYGLEWYSRRQAQFLPIWTGLGR